VRAKKKLSEKCKGQRRGRRHRQRKYICRSNTISLQDESTRRRKWTIGGHAIEMPGTRERESAKSKHWGKALSLENDWTGWERGPSANKRKVWSKKRTVDRNRGYPEILM